MDKKYLTYKIEDLAEDKSFVAWVQKGNNSDKWNKFILDNPEFKAKAQKAKEVILLLQDKYEDLSEEAILQMWQNIDRVNQTQKSIVRRLEMRKILSWAASVFLIISLGTFGYFYLNERESVYQFSSNEISKTTNEALLILSDGEEVALKKDNSTVALNTDNQLVINRDSIIDLNSKVLNTEDENQMNEAVIPYGKRLELLLADGTKVWLNAGSKLAFPSKFNKKNREVYLEGEACFKVAKNEKQPFIVKAGKLDIEVLGTFFDVSAYPVDGTIETVLLEGSVAVKKPGLIGLSKNVVILKPNQRAHFNKENQEFKISDDPNASVSVAWTEGWLQFSSENLQSVFTKLERYYNIEIQASGNFASTQYITGKLDLKDSLELVMKALGDVAKLNYRINDNKVYIDKKMDEIKRK